MPATTKLERIERTLARHRPDLVALDGRPARAAVAIVLEPRADDLYCFFIHRAAVAGDPWSGHMGFPGGFKEDSDVDLLETAVREVQEEVGVDLHRCARLLGRLDEIQGVARGRQLELVISPFLFVLAEPVVVVPNHEVQGTIWVPLSFLEDARNESIVEHRIGDQTLRLPAFIYEDRTIWGLTFRMLRNFLDVVSRRSEE